jgi:Putative prokaryotic signal transducing protein
MWTCPKCHTRVDPSFDVCWKCGTTSEGVEDSTFVSADDTGPIAGDPVVPELDVEEDVAVEGDLPEPIQGDLVEAYHALDLMEAKFLADQLNGEGIQAVSDTHDLHDALGSMDSGPRVWVRAEHLPRARAWLASYDRNKVAQAGQ